MRKKLAGLLHYDNIFHSLFILFTSGIICGILLSQWMNAELVQNLSASFFSTILHSEIDQKKFFITQFSSNLLFILLIIFIGFSVLGIPVICFIIFTKGVQIGFSSSLYIITYQLKGMLGIILTLLPQVMFDAISVFLISKIAFEISVLLFKRCFFNTRKIEWKQLIDQKMNGVLMSIFIILLSSIIKSTIVVSLMELFALIQS